MADLPILLLASLAPGTRKEAEQALSSLADQPGFVEALLRLVLDKNGDKGARLAGSVYLKNVVKRKWDDDTVETSQQIAPTDKAGLRQALVPAMIALSTPADKALRAQIAETVAVVARKDFPGEWGDLIDQLVNSLSPTEYNINLGVLETAHSIFSPWRSQVRSDALFTTINFVLGRFVDPYLALLRQTAGLLLGGDARAEVAGTMRVLVDLYHDLTCQDLPPAIEDSHLEFWGADVAQGQQGMFLRFLEWDPVALRGDEDDAAPSIPSLIKAGILEVAEMYTKLYPEMVSKSPTVEAIIRAVWALVGAGRLQGVAYDGLVTQALRFISSTIRSGHYKTLFSSPETIAGLGEGVVVPNVMLREHDIEQFEDDPLEYVRLDLSATSGLTDSSTRRQAAADVLRALVAAGFEAETTRLAQGWVAQGLESYKVDRENGWRAKDSAVFVLSAVAARGGTAQAGVTSTNALIDIIDFFSNHVFGDLQPATPPAHPILAADAIRFLYTFRNQLTKEQLLSVLPLLVHHLGNPSYVVYTYAAVCIERILFIKQGGKLLFTQADVHDFAQGLLDALLSKIEAGGSAEKIAENDYLMKSAMRVILTARQTLTPGHAATLQRLVNILGVTAKNPSNPNFDQYLFESIAALIRFVVAGSPGTLPGFEQALFGPFTFIIQQEVEQYIPYAFQILAQMLALHPANGGVPDAYKSLLPFLLVPGPWEQKGSVPGLVALLRAYLAADARAMVAAGQHVNVLAIVQQRLIRSRINDAWGFELLRSVVQYVPSEALRPQLRAVLITLLTRMQESKTDGYVAGFAHFIVFAMALDGPGVITPDVWITESEGVQAGLWTTLLNTFVIPQVPRFQPRDRKMAAVGLTRMLSTPQMLQSAAPAWPPAFTALVQLFSQPQLLASAQSKITTEDEGGVSAIDIEEQAAGYQAAYSRLVAAEPVREDVVAYVPDPQAYVVQRFREASAASGGTLAQAVAAADQGVVGGFVGILRGAGVQV